MVKHVIWSNIDLKLEDWRKEIIEAHPSVNDEDEYSMSAAMYDLNNEYLDDERVNLNIKLGQPIICIANCGFWSGYYTGCRIIESGNIADCLYTQCDYAEWFVDGYKNLRCTSIHHDGRNHYLYRVFKNGTTYTQRENLEDKIYRGIATPRDIGRVTRSIGKEIGRVYGWN